MAVKSKTKKGIFFLTILILAGAVVATFIYVTKPKKISDTDQVNEAAKQEAEKKDAEVAKSAENKNVNQDNLEKTQAKASTSASTPSVTISSASKSGDNVYVNALIAGSTSGTCKLTLTNGNTKIEKSAGVGLQVSYYICQGFTVPASELVPKGDWNALIELSSPNGNAKSEVKKVTVQ